MKIVIYTVSEKRPPVEEPIIRYNMTEGEIEEMTFSEALIAIPDSQEERDLIPTGVVEDLIWSDGFDMRYEDHWSFVSTKNGD